jgi:uncharacterized protein YdbL (DUF1318 family)
MSLIMMSLDETVLLQSFANAVTLGNARVKPLMIEKLDGNLSLLHTTYLHVSASDVAYHLCYLFVM